MEAAGNDSSGEESDEDGSGPVTERTSYRTRNDNQWKEHEDRRLSLRKEVTTVEGVYFLYQFDRNQWRSTQKDGADLSDVAYRKSTKLPKYKKKDLKLWAEVLSITSQGMPMFCTSRQAPYNVWTMEEKLAWMDKVRAEDDFSETEMQAIHDYWLQNFERMAPGHLDYTKAENRQKRGLQLTDLEQATLQHSYQARLVAYKLQLQNRLDTAHQEIAERDPLAFEDTEDPFGIDWAAADIGQIKAQVDTKEAMET